jgi:hypothetical protein
MLNNNIADQFKVSNMPNMTGWNSSMTVRSILEQLEMLYGKPDTVLLFQNNTLFRSPFPATEAPEMLFYRIEQMSGYTNDCSGPLHSETNNQQRYPLPHAIRHIPIEGI